MEEVQNKDEVLTVSQLTGLIKTMLEGTFPSIQLKGEISNLRPNATGHLYFVLKDSESQISAVMFRGRAAALNFQPKDGTLVQVRGAVSVYPPRGNYQIIISSMTKAGTGDIMEMIEERKKKLAAEGLFDSSKKKFLPFFPSTVGVVTSPTGAALRDILQIIKRRNSKVSVIVFPALVQGESAAASITKMIKEANKWKLCDVLIVGRGGGSLEDLLPFSEENVVRAVAASSIPVISAVGHEIDWALSDYAADKRAPTPSAAAELAVPLETDIKESLTVYKNELYESIKAKVEHLRLFTRAFSKENMELQFRHIEQPLSMRFDSARENLKNGIMLFLQNKRQLLLQCTQTLNNCNPQTIFDRGYSMVTDSKGRVIRDSSCVKEGDTIYVRPSHGTISAKVLESNEEREFQKSDEF